MTQNNNISDKDNEENMRVTIIFLLRLIFKNISQMLSIYFLRFIKIRLERLRVQLSLIICIMHFHLECSVG